MARQITCGFERKSVTAGVEIDAVSGTLSIETTKVRPGGGNSLKCAPTASTASARWNISGANQAIKGWARTYFMFDSFPAGSAVSLILFNTSGGGLRGSVGISSAGKLQVFKMDGTQLGSDSAVLSTGHWYRLELFIDATTTPGTLTARYVDCGTSGIDPGDGSLVTVATGSNSTGASSWARVLVGLNTNTSSAVAYFDDVGVNDSSGTAQNTWCGSGNVVALNPNAQGDANGFLVNVGGTVGVANNYTRVNEVPPDDATSYNASAVLNAEDLFKCQSVSLGTGDTISVVAVGVRYSNLVAADATAAFKVELEKASGGTKTQSAAIVPNSTSWVSNSATGCGLYPIVTYLDPGGSPWTPPTVNTAQIGYVETVANVRAIAITNTWLTVEYVPVDSIAVTLAGTSSLSATVTEYHTIAVSLAGTSSLSTTLTPYKRLTVTLAGTSTLAATVVPYQRISATLAGTSSLSVGVTRYQRISVSLTGTSTLTASLTPYQRISVSLAGTSSLAASVSEYQRISVVLAGTSQLAAILTSYVRFAVELSGIGTLAAIISIIPAPPSTGGVLGGGGFPPNWSPLIDWEERLSPASNDQDTHDEEAIAVLTALGLL